MIDPQLEERTSFSFRFKNRAKELIHQLAGKAMIWKSVDSKRADQRKPGELYSKWTTGREKEILKDLKSADIANIRSDIRPDV